MDKEVMKLEKAIHKLVKVFEANPNAKVTRARAERKLKVLFKTYSTLAGINNY